MLYLGLIVALVSLVEIAALLNESLKFKEEETPGLSFEIRTYDD